MPGMMLFSGNANHPLAERIAHNLNIPLGKALVDHFSDGETRVEIQENVRGREIFLIQSTCAPSNDTLMELIIMADALRRASAARIAAVVPYFGYARQDRRVRSARVPITAKIVADMMAAVGISRLVTVDLHADQIQGFFYMPVDNLYTTKVMLDDIAQKDYQNVMVVSPDIGGVIRARAIAKRIAGADLAIIDKRRPQPNEAQVMHIIGDVRDRDCVIVDDIADTAGTLCKAAEALKDHGAARIAAYVTHPVLSGEALHNISNSVIDELVVTNTIPLSDAAKSCKRIRSIDLSPMIGEAIRRITDFSSVSRMFPD
ncbi:MAG: ribose-phosphate pyrophosphokinase [Gammaproteobacteria bacterium]|nr:ribose-phosphate pyrophosphokinase [Gammaproteobacteria bacterium]